MAKTVEHLNALPSGSRLKEYEILGVLGSGGFGVTYRGVDHWLGKTVAIKEYLPNDMAIRSGQGRVLPKSTADQEDFEWGLERFLEEARALALFDHPNIVRVHRFFQENGTGYIVMDYVEGETLGDLLDRERALSPARLKELLFPLLDGLEALHRMDFLHRDIKPDNVILLQRSGAPVIIDFGAARQAINSKSRSVTAIFTPGYAPVEQYSTRGDQGPEADIYSLAAVAYCAIMGHRPEDATNRLANDPLDGWTLRAQGWDPVFLAAIDKGLAVNKADRPQTVAEWREMLSASGSSLGAPTSDGEAADRGRSLLTARQHTVRLAAQRWSAAAALAIALVAGGYWLWLGGASPTENVPTEEALAVGPDESAHQSTVQRIEAALAGNDVDGAEALLAELSPDHPQRDALSSAAAEARSKAQRAATAARLVAAARSRIAVNEPSISVLRDAVAELSEALTLDPDNGDVRASLRSIQDRYVALIDDALSAALPELAEQWLHELERTGSDHPGLPALRERISGLARQAARAAEVEALLREARAKLASNQLMLPEGDNAVADFRRVLALDPDNVEARAGLGAVEARYVELIRLAVRDQAPERGRQLLANLRALNPGHPDGAQLDADLEAIEVSEPTAPVQPAPQPAANLAEKVRDEEDILWNSVKDSCRKGDLERYCNAYPNGRHIEACWRKLSECLRQSAVESG